MAALILLAAAGQCVLHTAVSASDILVLTATACERGIDSFPGDGVFDSVFVGGPCSLFAQPASVQQSAEERVAVEFPLVIKGGWFSQPLPAFSSATLVLTAANGPTGNLGLAADEVVEAWIYSGNGAITVSDLQTSGKVKGGLLAGPTADGPVSVTLSPKALTLALSTASRLTPPYLGVMLKARRGVSSVSIGFAETDAVTPFAWRPKLQVRFAP